MEMTNMGSFHSMLLRLGLVGASDHASIVAINIFVTLLCTCIIIGHLLEENRWMNESITALVSGLCTGGFILLSTGGKSSRILVFSEDLFFIYLLPPIIFNAGFQVKKKQFFRNFITIMFFGAVGTLISFGIISAGAWLLFKNYDVALLDFGDYLAIGAIFSATDSVCTLQVLNQEETPFLYSLVFGEGVVNDATSVVLFNAIQNFDLSHVSSTTASELILSFLYLFVMSTFLGIVAGLLSAYTIKKLYFGRHSTDREVALMILMAYLSYMLAEIFNLSAILTVFFCGIVMSHYTWHNVTESSRVTTKHAFATMSFIAETFIFLYVGMDALDIEKWRLVSSSPGESIRLSSMLLGFVMVGRAAFVFPLSFMTNLTKNSPSEKINLKQQVIIWWAGLMRGAVSMALSYNQFTRSGYTQLRGNAIMITCTITVVLFSTVVFGLLTKPLIRILLPHNPRATSSLFSEPSSPKSFLIPFLEDSQTPESDPLNVPRPTSLRSLLTKPTRTVHYWWRRFDDAYMRPMFGGRGFVPFVPGSPTEQSSNDHSAYFQ
ncbi:sodium/hydrogen exchanger 1-like [Nymphaea colorata]|nr:sodium/hydrogen exchanger 1-like [Nymphaea colorata]XP_031486509.1 sodium/hydrogen exchanger 1-like [Nymphaea colorata]XP_031486510.1 sodium/hydrogen exchanger 1-like [Nymphaea colorata]XP_031486511.1 sodium/hydrogen exchanger 1-like [Nymphaea colorata]XP_031486512.1 sodium/hydrogen exchanger 1-like [Nymphaea colorata]XP_049933718.1 sodium/hydrogen exchanger 1-like [Nymphaea colorata]XP_049933719.1 sodium/hydrogen exchanger 1-like [Nymphaea colorata]